jgi:hypothetical protein
MGFANLLAAYCADMKLIQDLRELNRKESSPELREMRLAELESVRRHASDIAAAMRAID